MQLLQAFKYAHITTATTTNLSTVPTKLQAITVNAALTGSITINDGNGGTTIAVITNPTVGETIWYNIGTNVGLSIVTSATCDITVSYVF